MITTVTQRKPDSRESPIGLRQLSFLGARFQNGLRPLLGALSLRFPQRPERCDRINQQRCCRAAKILASSYRNAAGALLREFGRSKSEFPVLFFSLVGGPPAGDRLPVSRGGSGAPQMALSTRWQSRQPAVANPQLSNPSSLACSLFLLFHFFLGW